MSSVLGDASGVEVRMLEVPEYTLKVEEDIQNYHAKVSVTLSGVSSSHGLDVELVQGRYLEVRCPER